MREEDLKKKEILEWLKENFSGKFSVEFTAKNEIIVNGNIRLDNCEMTNLKFPFAVVHGNFHIGGHKFPSEGQMNFFSMNTLANCPRVVDGDFYCAKNPKLKSLVGGPEKVGGIYRCNNCDLENLDGIAKEIGTFIQAYSNHRLKDISALEGVQINKTCDFEFADESLFQTKTYKNLLQKNKIFISPPIRWD